MVQVQAALAVVAESATCDKGADGGEGRGEVEDMRVTLREAVQVMLRTAAAATTTFSITTDQPTKLQH